MLTYSTGVYYTLLVCGVGRLVEYFGYGIQILKLRVSIQTLTLSRVYIWHFCFLLSPSNITIICKYVLFFSYMPPGCVIIHYFSNYIFQYNFKIILFYTMYIISLCIYDVYTCVHLPWN